MAEIFENPQPLVSPSINQQSSPSERYTGNDEIDRYLSTLPEDERSDAIKYITAPKSGEEILKDMNAADSAGEIYDPSKEDWIKLKEYQRTVDNDNLELLTKAGAHVYELFGKGLEGAKKNPTKIPRSVVEAFAQGSRNLYGIAAMSQDSTSPQARLFNAIHGYEEDSDAAYREFLRARNFVRESNALANGTKTIVMDKDHINHDFVQAASLVADPTLFIPFGGIAGKAMSLVGMGEKALLISAKVNAIKNAIIGGGLKWGVGAPIEFVGKATRGTIDYGISKAGNAFESIVGVSSKEFEEILKPSMKIGGLGSIGAGSLGYSIPYASSITGAYAYANFFAGAGEALGAIGGRMRAGPRGLASYASDALRMSAKEGMTLSPHAQKLLKVIDKFDPLFSYGGHIAEGSAKGAFIGGTLGYWSGGRDGAWSGIGAGIALGSIGAGAGKFVSDVSGSTRRMQTHITAKYALEMMKEVNPEQAVHWQNGEIWANSHGSTLDGLLAAKEKVHPKTELYLYDGEMYDSLIRSKGMDPEVLDGLHVAPDGELVMGRKQFNQHNGFVVESMPDGRVRVYINADTAGRPTIGHEIYHSVLRTSVLKDLYVKQVKDGVLGIRNEKGELTTRPVVSIDEFKKFSRRYIKAEYKDPQAYQDAMDRLIIAEREFENNGRLINDPDLGRPMLENLAEEFGAFYFSHMIADKPIDWLWHGGDLPGIRGLFENASLAWTKYMKSRLNDAVPEFNFDRTFIDPETGLEKPVTIDQVFAPLGRGLFGGVKSNRVINPALDMLMKDMLRIESTINETGSFDISRMSKDAQRAIIEGNGLDGIFERQPDGTYRNKTASQIAKENKFKGKEVHKLLMSIPADKRTFKVDAEGNIRGPFSDDVLDLMVNSGHVSREMVNKIRLFQNIINKNVDYNVIDFGGIGATMERPSTTSNPPRIRGSAVPFKSRTAIVFGLDIKISANGKFEFHGNMLDYSNIQTRALNIWNDPSVQSLWNGNHTDYMTDLFRYLENASKNHDDDSRVPSAKLWTDNLGGERRNVMHQIMGMAKTEADVYLNPPSGVIPRNHLSTVFTFSLNRMTNLRLRNQKVPFDFKNAYTDIKLNFHPNEAEGEHTPNGVTYRLPNGYTYFVKKGSGVAEDGSPISGRVDLFDDKGIRLGNFRNMEEASVAARKNLQKNPPMVLNRPIYRDYEFGTVGDLRQYASARGYNLSGYRHMSPTSGITVFNTDASAINRSQNPAGIYFRHRDYGQFSGRPEDKVTATAYDAVLSLHNPYKLGDFNDFKQSLLDSYSNQIRKRFAGRSDETINYKVQEYLNSAKRTGRLDPNAFSDGYEFRDFLIRHGFDGIDDGMDKAVFYPEQIKSEQLITHDNLGNPIPKVERFNKRSADIRRSPNEGAGEEILYNIKRGPLKFRDSLSGYGAFELTEGSDPFPFNDIRDYDKDFNGHVIKLDPARIPSPKSDTLYSYIKWHHEFKKKITIKDVLIFLTEQGKSIHSNVARSYYSQWAETLLAFAPERELGRIITLHKGKDSYASVRETVISLRHTKKLKFDEKPEGMSDTEMIKEGLKEKEESFEEDESFGDVDDLIESESRTKKIEKEDASTTGEEEGKYNREIPISTNFPHTYLPLEKIINKLFDRAAQRRYEYTGKGEKITSTATARERLRLALSGHSFEGIMLEEIGHTFEQRIQIAAETSDQTGFLQKIFKQEILKKGETPTEMETGRPWQILVEKFINSYETMIRDGREAEISTIPLQYARILKLLKYASENIYMKNEKTGEIVTMWDSKGINWNESFMYLNKNGEVSLKSTRGKLKTNWVVLGSRRGNLGNLDAGNVWDKGVGKVFESQSGYRFKYPWEFIISLFNTPDHMAWFANIKPDPKVLETLDLPHITEGHLPNVASLENQMNASVSRFLSYEGNPNYSFANTLTSEVIRLYELGRRGSRGFSTRDNAHVKDISSVDLQVNKETTAFLPERPEGYLTEYEKQYIHNNRVALKTWAREGKGVDFLDGLTEWEAWQELKNKADNPDYWNWYNTIYKIQKSENYNSSRESVITGVNVDPALMVHMPDMSQYKKIIITDKKGNLDVVYVDSENNVINPETGQIDKKKTNTLKDQVDKKIEEINTEQNDVEKEKDKTESTRETKDKDTESETTTTERTETRDRTQITERTEQDGETSGEDGINTNKDAFQTRNLTVKDFRVRTDWIPEYHANNNYSIKNGLGYIIMFMGNNYRLYNPQRALIGIYKNQDEAKRRANREMSRK